MSDTSEKTPNDAGETKPEPVTTPVDGEAQEEAGKVREKSGGYD